MGAIKEMFRPSAAKLAEHVSELEAEIARLTVANDQAEAEAVVASADPVAYVRAAAAADKIKTEITTQAARLERLKRAHAETEEREQQDYLQRLTTSRDEARATLQAVVTEVAESRQAEDVRHEKALANIAAREAAAKSALSNAEHTLRDAEAGITEAEAQRLVELQAAIRQTCDEYGDDLDQRATAANSIVLSVKMRRDTGHGDAAELQREWERVQAAAQTVDEKKRERDSKVRALIGRVEAIRAKVAQRPG